MKHRSRDNAIRRVVSRQDAHQGRGKSYGETLPGSLNPHKGSREPGVHSMDNVKQRSRQAVAARQG
jgi:hypothetical protein